jgi:hypothetical protein
MQCCGAETFCFRSRSDFQNISAPAPEPDPYLPIITDFILKSGFFMFFLKKYHPNSHAGFYTIWIFIFIYYSSWPGAGSWSWSWSRNFDIPASAKSSGSLQLRLHNTDLLSSLCPLMKGKIFRRIYYRETVPETNLTLVLTVKNISKFIRTSTKWMFLFRLLSGSSSCNMLKLTVLCP